jgi:hypothetical protein
MAKIAPINISLTGDTKGLDAATARARAQLRTVEEAAKKSQARLKAFGEQSMRTQGVLGQFGVGGRGLGMLGGASMLGAMGGMGLGLGAAGLALAAGSTVLSAQTQVPAMRKRAAQALEAEQTDQRRRIEESGLSSALARAIAGNAPRVTAASQLGLVESFTAGLATQRDTFQGFAINEGLGAMLTGVGAIVGGSSLSEANKLFQAQISTGDALADTQRSISLINSIPFGSDILRYMMSR